MGLEQLDATLPGVFQSLKALAPKIIHYKVCSTFDSSPAVGSIGRAIEHAIEVFHPTYVPLVVGAPQLARYTVFGTLFARAGLDSPVFRLDRHPAMSQHPVTPMHEADIRRHLAHQTDLAVGLVDVLDVTRGIAHSRQVLSREVSNGNSIVLIDLLDQGQLAAIGELLSEQNPSVVVGSSGVEAALVDYWGRIGLVAGASDGLRPLDKVDRVLVLSGSASSVTAAQIECAMAAGYQTFAADTRKLANPQTARRERKKISAQVTTALRGGSSAIVHTALGPRDARIASTGTEIRSVGAALAQQLGLLLVETLQAVRVERTVVVGGDTSAHVSRALGTVSLQAFARSAPGAPLCRVTAPGSPADGIELILKGGQVGSRSYFSDIKGGAQ
jgi:uncharacterized protein YgbK (DUF1537 family)